MSEYQAFIDVALGICMSVLGWFAREMWAAVKELKSDLAKLREEIPQTYITRPDYRQDAREIKEMLNKIFDRLERKADKQT